MTHPEELRALVEALKPFAEYSRLALSAENIDPERVEIGIYTGEGDREVTVADFRRARIALTRAESVPDGAGEAPIKSASVPGGWWMPIEGAPKDKTMVALLYEKGSYRRYGVGWYMPLDGWQGWYAEGFYNPPTHFLPLPASPQGSSENG